MKGNIVSAFVAAVQPWTFQIPHFLHSNVYQIPKASGFICQPILDKGFLQEMINDERKNKKIINYPIQCRYNLRLSEDSKQDIMLKTELKKRA